MIVSELIEILSALPPDTEIQVQTSRYDGNSEQYTPEPPYLMVSENRAILTGIFDYYAQLSACLDISLKSRREIIGLLAKNPFSNRTLEV